MSETITSLYEFITNLIGDVPPELDSLVYVLLLITFFYIIYLFFQLLFIVFGVSKWK